MQCYQCGHELAANEARCAACGSPRSALMLYAPFCAAAGGLVGSLVGFTAAGDIPTALIGGLIGIVLAECGARLLLRPRRA